MKKVILISIGTQDQLLIDGRSALAEHASVGSDTVIGLDALAEHALNSQDGVLATCFTKHTDFIIGCSRPRAVQALLSFAGIVWQTLHIEWVSFPFDQELLKRAHGVPWYPVIDRTRCTGCGTCLQYCLFSVYESSPLNASSQCVKVNAPLNCKTGCPACARLCPEAALIFPFCAEADLNGQIENPERRSREVLMQTLGDDPMRILAERQKKKQLIDPAKFKKAEQERITYSGAL